MEGPCLQIVICTDEPSYGETGSMVVGSCVHLIVGNASGEMNTHTITHRRRAVTAAILLVFVLAGCGGASHALNGRSLNDRYGCDADVMLQTPLTIDEFAKATKPKRESLQAWRRLIVQRSYVYGKEKFNKGDVLVLPRECSTVY